MNATRILPDLQCSLLCEDIRQEASGNLILIGVVNLLRVPQLPVVASRLLVFNRWMAGIGRFTETIRFIAPDQTTLLRKSEAKFELTDPSGQYSNITGFGNVEFKVPGAYFIEVLVDDVMKLRYSVPVIQMPPPNKNPQQPAAEKRD